MQHTALDSHVVCVILEDGAFVAGDTSTGFTCYSYPNSPNAVRAWSLRGHRPELVAFAGGVMADIEAGIQAGDRRRVLRSFADFHARNWERLGRDPRELGLPRLAAAPAQAMSGIGRRSAARAPAPTTPSPFWQRLDQMGCGHKPHIRLAGTCFALYATPWKARWPDSSCVCGDTVSEIQRRLPKRSDRYRFGGLVTEAQRESFADLTHYSRLPWR